MRSKSIYAIGVTIAAMGLATLTLPTASAAHDVAAEIEKVRIATLKYHDVKVALAEGYIPAPVRTEKKCRTRRSGKFNREASRLEDAGSEDPIPGIAPGTRCPANGHRPNGTLNSQHSTGPFSTKP